LQQNFSNQQSATVINSARECLSSYELLKEHKQHKQQQ
jgi:hypothetical protein